MSYSGGMAAVVVPLHLGALHPMETLLMAALALGPFVILAVVVTVVSRRDRRAEACERGQATREATAREGAGSTTSDTAAPQSVQQ
jgi:hypothetical protein